MPCTLLTVLTLLWWKLVWVSGVSRVAWNAHSIEYSYSQHNCWEQLLCWRSFCNGHKTVGDYSQEFPSLTCGKESSQWTVRVRSRESQSKLCLGCVCGSNLDRRPKIEIVTTWVTLERRIHDPPPSIVIVDRHKHDTSELCRRISKVQSQLNVSGFVKICRVRTWSNYCCLPHSWRRMRHIWAEHVLEWRR